MKENIFLYLNIDDPSNPFSFSNFDKDYKGESVLEINLKRFSPFVEKIGIKIFISTSFYNLFYQNNFPNPDAVENKVVKLFKNYFKNNIHLLSNKSSDSIILNLLKEKNKVIEINSSFNISNSNYLSIICPKFIKVDNVKKIIDFINNKTTPSLQNINNVNSSINNSVKQAPLPQGIEEKREFVDFSIFDSSSVQNINVEKDKEENSSSFQKENNTNEGENSPSFQKENNINKEENNSLLNLKNNLSSFEDGEEEEEINIGALSSQPQPSQKKYNSLKEYNPLDEEEFLDDELDLRFLAEAKKSKSPSFLSLFFFFFCFSLLILSFKLFFSETFDDFFLFLKENFSSIPSISKFFLSSFNL